MKRNVAGQAIGAQLNSRGDGTPLTSGVVTVYVTGDNGAQATGSVGAGACTHKGKGAWTYAPAQAETDFAHIMFTFEHATGVNATVQVYPTNGIIVGSYTAEDILRVLAGVAAGKTDIDDQGGGAAEVTFRHIDDTGDVVVAQMQGSKRLSVTVTP